MKKIGIIRSHPEGNERPKIEKLFAEYLGKEYEPRFMHWEDMTRGKIAPSRKADEQDLIETDISKLDIIYINTLGAIREKMPSFLEFLAKIEGMPARVINDPKTFRYNLDKAYLLYLQDKGIPVIPTEDVSHLKDKDLPLIYGGKAVLKPRRFGERMNGVIRAEELKSVEEAEKYRETYGREILAQPFLEEINKNGERSLVFVGDTFSHAIWRKRVAWKSNPGGLWERTTPTREELKIAKNTFSIWPTQYHITRFDFISRKGNPLISEVEMGNPNLWIGNGKKRPITKRFILLLKRYLEK